MKRRLFLTLALGAVWAGSAAFAQSFTDSVVDQLRRQGFARINVDRTFLGRTRIVASGKGGQREIILNPRTGEILRDLWNRGMEAKSDHGALIRDEDDAKGEGRGRAEGEDDDDKDDGSSGAKDDDGDIDKDRDGDSDGKDGDDD